MECLIVFDGLQSTDEWDSLKAAFGWSDFSHSKTKIFVVTYELSVARHCVDNNDDLVINVKGLDDDVAIHLFSQTVHTLFCMHLLKFVLSH